MSSPQIKLNAELEYRIRQVAVHLRRQTWVRGWVRFGVITLSLTLLFTLALLYGGHIGLSRNMTLLGFVVCELIAGALTLALPLRRPITPRQVAQFIDEHYPELQNRMITAVEMSSRPLEGESAWMVEQLVAESRVMARRIGVMEMVSPGLIAQLAFIAAFFLLVAGAVILARVDLWKPEIAFNSKARRGGFLSAPFVVEPGDARVRQGDNLVILVKSETTGKPVNLRWRSGDGAWTQEVMPQGTTEKVHHYQFFNLQQDVEYQALFGSQGSPVYTIDVWLPPEVVAIDLGYRYPEYLNWPPREVPNGGNISGIEGSKVELRVQTNKAVSKAEMALESGGRIPLKKQLDTTWITEIELTKNDKYQIELMDEDGAASVYNPSYDIAVQPDKPPVVKIQFPRGDGQVTMLEEAPFSFQVTDDYGLASYGLEYEIVGRGKQRIELASATEPTLEAAGDKTLFLEDFGLNEGDLINWTVYARDQKPNRPPEDEIADIYFLEVRPFETLYREAVSGAGGMQGMGQDQDSGSVKEIIIATHNAKREASGLTPEEFLRRREIIQKSLSDILMKNQGRLAMTPPDKQELANRLIDELGKALESLMNANLPDPVPELDKTLEHLSAAYQAMLALKPRQNEVMQSMSGQGMSGQQPDVDQLEMDKNKNFYEDEKRTQEKQEAAEQAMNALKELAKRQELINEEIARLISEMAKAQTEAEKRELECQLERLREEQKANLEKLDQVQRQVNESQMDPRQNRDAAKGLDDARKQMNESLERLRDNELQQARSSGSRAASQLQDIAKKLEGLSRGAAAERMKNLQKEFENLGKEQKDIQEKLAQLREEYESGSGASPGELEKKREDLMTQKAAATEKFKKLMEDAGSLSEKAAHSQELMSRKLGDWLRRTSADGIYENMKESEPMVRYGVWDSAEQKEREISDKLDKASGRLKEVADAMVQDDVDAMRKALAELEQALDPAGANAGDKPGAGDQKNPDELAQGSGDPNNLDQHGAGVGDRPTTDTLAGGGKGEPGEEEKQIASAGADDFQKRMDEIRKQMGGAGDASARERMNDAVRKMGGDPGALDDAKSVQDLARGMGIDPNDPKSMDEFRRALTEAMRAGGDKAGDQSEEKPGDKSGDQPGENSGQEPGEKPGEKPGEEPGDTPGSKPGEQGSKPGERSGGQPGDQPGSEPGDQSGEQQGGDQAGSQPGGDKPGQRQGSSGDTPGSQPGERGQRGQGQQGQAGDQPGGQGDDSNASSDDPQSAQNTDPSSNGRPGSQRGAMPLRDGRAAGRGASTPDGPFDPSALNGADPNGIDGGLQEWTHPPAPDFNEKFFQGTADKWVEQLRDAEALLPKDSPERQRLERVRDRIQQMRADFKRHSLAPRYDMLLRDVIKPMTETAKNLELEILKTLKEKEFALTNEGDAPAQYTRRVADYFESLSAVESQQSTEKRNRR